MRSGDVLVHSHNTECRNCALPLVLGMMSLLIVVCCVVSGGESKQTPGNMVERLQRDRDKAATEEEKAYYDFCIRHERLGEHDVAGLTSLRTELLAFGRTPPDNPYRARAIVFAGDISQVALNDSSSARSYYAEAQSVFLRHQDWPTSQYNLSYLGIRMGDSFAEEGQHEKAVSIWEDTFLGYPQNPFSAQIPVKIGLTNDLYLSRQEAWRKTMSFYDKALKAADAQLRPRLEVERIDFTFRAIRSIPFYAKTLVNEIDSLLGRYGLGARQFVDMRREDLVKIRDILKEGDEYMLVEAAENTITSSIHEEPLSEPKADAAKTPGMEALKRDPNLAESGGPDTSKSMKHKGNEFTLVMSVVLVVSA
jgi:tetratricopeptide (TPR) repeat protein